MLKRINWYPPYLGAGIRVADVNDELTRIKVEMKMRWYNRNLVGTHFGGSLYSMCDPHYMFIVMQYLGKGYIVWDKSAKIDFKKPGERTVHAIFEISHEKLEEIKADVEKNGKNTYWFSTEVIGDGGQVVALVEKEIYVRKK